jgi:hypothetical protein
MYLWNYLRGGNKKSDSASKHDNTRENAMLERNASSMLLTRAELFHHPSLPQPAVKSMIRRVCAVQVSLWDNIFGPRVERVWDGCECLTNKTASAICSYIFDGEMGQERDVADSRYLKLNNVHAHGYFIVSLLFHAHCRGIESPFSLSVCFRSTDIRKVLDSLNDIEEGLDSVVIAIQKEKQIVHDAALSAAVTDAVRNMAFRLDQRLAASSAGHGPAGVPLLEVIGQVQNGWYRVARQSHPAVMDSPPTSVNFTPLKQPSMSYTAAMTAPTAAASSSSSFSHPTTTTATTASSSLTPPSQPASQILAAAAPTESASRLRVHSAWTPSSLPAPAPTSQLPLAQLTGLDADFVCKVLSAHCLAGGLTLILLPWNDPTLHGPPNSHANPSSSEAAPGMTGGTSMDLLFPSSPYPGESHREDSQGGGISRAQDAMLYCAWTLKGLLQAYDPNGQVEMVWGMQHGSSETFREGSLLRLDKRSVRLAGQTTKLHGRPGPAIVSMVNDALKLPLSLSLAHVSMHGRVIRQRAQALAIMLQSLSWSDDSSTTTTSSKPPNRSLHSTNSNSSSNLHHHGSATHASGIANDVIPFPSSAHGSVVDEGEGSLGSGEGNSSSQGNVNSHASSNVKGEQVRAIRLELGLADDCDWMVALMFADRYAPGAQTMAENAVSVVEERILELFNNF